MVSSQVPRTVLVAQQQMAQLLLWKQVLESQRYGVYLQIPEPNLLEIVTDRRPDLLIIDMTTKLFNPYAFCRDCRNRLPGMPVILTHQIEHEIQEAGRRWALDQGAADVIPGLSDAANIIRSIEQIHQSIGWPLPDPSSLQAALSRKTSPPPVSTNGRVTDGFATNGTVKNGSATSSSQTIQINYRGQIKTVEANPAPPDLSQPNPEPKPKRQIRYRGHLVDI